MYISANTSKLICGYYSSSIWAKITAVNKDIPFAIYGSDLHMLDVNATYNSLATLALGLWGDTVTGTVYSYDSILTNLKAEANRSRTVSKGYYFFANGKEYKGYVIYFSDEAWPRLTNGETRTEPIRHFSFFPYINKPSMLADLDEIGAFGLPYHLFVPFGCSFLFLLVSGRLQRKKKKRKRARKPGRPKKDINSQTSVSRE